MTNYSIDTDLLFDPESLSVEAISLSQEHVEQAVQLSQSVTEVAQWSTYLNALALFGVEQWLQERAADLRVTSDRSTVMQPTYANLIPSVCNLQVGTFKLCLIPTGSLTDTVVSVPRAVVDLPEFAAHFYVLVEVLEEQEQVRVQGVLRYDELAQHRQAGLTADSDWTYSVATDWFSPEPDTLLLYLRNLDAGAIALPSPRVASVSTTQLQAELEPILPQLRSGRPLWQLVSWEQGAAILRHPDLVNWLYQSQPSPEPAAPVVSPLAGLQNLAERAINVGLWLRDQLDDVAQELSWVLLPPMTTASAMRGTASLASSTDQAESVINQLRDSGVEIPPTARGAYRDFRWGHVSLRLYVMTWALPVSPNQSPEWTLLLILGAQPGTVPPEGVRLQVRDQFQPLVERVLTHDTPDSYLYARVIGEWHEQFWVTLDMSNGALVTLPPFSFNPSSQP